VVVGALRSSQFSRPRRVKVQGGVLLAFACTMAMWPGWRAFVPSPSDKSSHSGLHGQADAEELLPRRNVLFGGGLVAADWSGQLDAAKALTQQEVDRSNLFTRSTSSLISVTDMGNVAKGLRIGKFEKSGSGFVWDRLHVVTNYHVIADIAKPAVVALAKNEQGEDEHVAYEASIAGADPISDIAVLRVQIPSQDTVLKPLRRAGADELHVGQEVFALGDPFGLEHSMSRGIISGLSRTMPGAGGRPINHVIQTDAAINPGNSGGPLLNSDGSVIGINTAILTGGSGTNSGVGLAIPIQTVEQNVQNILERGFVTRPVIGAVLAPDDVSKGLGADGVMVSKVNSGSPAEDAGLQAMRRGRLGDFIVSFDGHPVGSTDEFFRALEDTIPGKTVVMQVKRASRSGADRYDLVDLKIKLGGTQPNF